MKHITSADNARYKHLKKLAGSARERRTSGQTLLDGVHLLQAVAEAGASVDMLVLRQGSEDEAEIQACARRFPAVPALMLAPALFDALSPVETPAGILALYTIPEPEQRQLNSAVLLENIQDPGNLGSILRSAAAAGVDAVYLSRGCAEAWSPKALRAGMGAHFTIAIYEQCELTALPHQFDSIVATRLGAMKSVYDLDLKGRVAFLFGNEGAGLSPELAALATYEVKIPMPGRIESLNVAAAVAVCLFERVRQKFCVDRCMMGQGEKR